VSAAVARENGIKLVKLEELIAGSDYITLHVGLTPQTTGVINAKTLAKMKKGVRIINCARGELIEDAALVEALRAPGGRRGAGVCLPWSPPRRPVCRTGQRDSDAAHCRFDGRGAGSGGHPDCAPGARLPEAGRGAECREPAVADPRGYVQLAPYIDLAGRLGGFLAQAGKDGIESIHLVYGGALAEAKIDLVRNAAIEGLLQGSENVNRINATAVAEERGIRIHEDKEESHRGGAASVLTIELHTAAAQATPLERSSTKNSRGCLSSMELTSKPRSRATCWSAATWTSPASLAA